MHLKEETSVTLEVFVDKDENLRGIFYQNHSTKQLYAAFPEILLINATHKGNEIRVPLNSFLICNGNGQSEVVAV